MKKLMLTVLLAGSLASAHAGWFVSGSFGGPYYHGWGGWHSHYHYYYPGVSFAYSYYPAYSYAYPVYSYPAYSYDYSAYPSYSYARPNYAVGGTLLGALTGGLIGNSIHHQGWEGAGIGAAAGLVLGSLAEHNARVQEGAYANSYAAPQVYHNSSQPQAIQNAPTVNIAPTVPDAPTVPNAGGSSSMSSANSLFGR